MGRKLENLAGQRFGELVVVELHKTETGRPTLWKCLCDCGETTITQAPRLKSGKTRSCGHLRTHHGMYETPTYRSWNAMITRCTIETNTNYHKYGAVGITVCERWRSFENFYCDMGERPEGTTLNRVFGATVYSKDTCEWADASVQSYDQCLDPRNTSGVKGVRWREDRAVWTAYISRDREVQNLYYGVDFFEAVCRRKSAEQALYGFGR